MYQARLYIYTPHSSFDHGISWFYIPRNKHSNVFGPYLQAPGDLQEKLLAGNVATQVSHALVPLAFTRA